MNLVWKPTTLLVIGYLSVAVLVKSVNIATNAGRSIILILTPQISVNTVESPRPTPVARKSKEEIRTSLPIVPIMLCMFKGNNVPLMTEQYFTPLHLVNF